MSQKTILIVDDEPSILKLLSLFLSRHQYRIIEAATAEEMFAHLRCEQVDCILLDLMLPDAYGIDVCKKVRETWSTPIILLTAVTGETNTVLGFEAGADDYVEKPFSVHIILARIKALLHRVEKQTQTVKVTEPLSDHYTQAAFGPWTYLRDQACIKHNSGRHIFLTRGENALLHLILTHQQVVLSREKLASALALDPNDVESRAIDVQISRLRAKLKDRAQSNLIKSIRNKGYILSVPVRFQA